MRLALIAAAALLPAAPAGAQVVIGADLNRPANATYGCETFPGTDFAGNRAFYPSGQTSCTYLASGRLGGDPESTTATAPGIVTRVRVKVGPVTGPMRITVLQATRSAGGFACCFWAGESQVFTPAPNGVTAVPVRLPMRADFNPAFGETVDRLALTVLAPNVPIPAHEIGSPGDITQPAVGIFAPHVRPGDERADAFGTAGLVPLISADFFPLCSADAARAAQAGTCLPGVQLSGDTARLRGANAVADLACNLGITCTGELRLQSSRTGGRLYGRAPFTVAAGARRSLSVRLTRAGRALKRRTTAYAVARVTGNGASATIVRRITLRR